MALPPSQTWGNFPKSDLGAINSCAILNYMLFNKKHQKKIQVAWAVVSVLIIVSMILLYSPMFR
jgi:predicted nucleic acid-binding Zn ribbon protein